MAKKKKVAKQASRKRAPGKKRPASRNASKKKTPRATVVNGIGVLSSITFSPALRAAFLQGGPNVNIVAVSDGTNDNDSYNQHRMATAVQTWNDDTAHIGLIVAVGGVGAATVALNNATTPWIALIGGAPASFPSSPLSFFKGAVSLESYTYNAQRRAHLTAPHARAGKGIPLQNICLLYNPNSACSATEAHDWPAQSPKVSAGINQHGLNDPITLWNPATQTGAFDTIPANVQAVIVSADPFFQDNKNPLVTAANNWVGQAGTNRFVCYPMPEYKNAQPNPTHRKRIFHGPSLEKAYTELGKRAASFIRNGTSFNLSKQQLDGPDED